ncbi:hypothetical protein PQX77_015237 [Marasmius sp. AFHP31]|nr:hypothetical protein PQX77_015237 [Marasmius sp. AFHP31]
MLRWYFLTQLILTVWGVELSVPSSWNKPTLEASREERINRAAAAIDAFIASDALFTSLQPPSSLSSTYWPYGEFLGLIADFDTFTNQTRYKQIAQERFLPALQQTAPNLRRYGYAAARAYIAYQDGRFLDIANYYWASSRSLTLSDADVQSRSSSAKSIINSTTSLACSKPGSEYTLAGGTFHDSIDQNDLNITIGSTADYLTLTVSLATVSSNLDARYMTLASQMGQFMRNTLYKEPGYFYSEIKVGDPDCPTRQYLGFGPDNVAVTMQSLSLLTLGSKNDDFTDTLRDVVRRASTWSSADGVLDAQKVLMATKSGDITQVSHRLLRSYFIMALGDGASDLRTYLRAYLAVQYDALVKQATFTSGTPNLYGSGLRPQSQLDPEAQILAITTLLGGVIDTTPNETRGSDTEDHRRVPIGAIVGGVVGGILGLVFVIGSYCWLRRKRRLQSSLPAVEPYQATSPSMTPPPSSTVPAPRSRRYEKETPSASPSISPRTATYSEFSTLTAPRPAPEPYSSRVPREATTAELVTLLNRRLGLEPRDVNDERWDGSQSPPDYSSQAGGDRT